MKLQPSCVVPTRRSKIDRSDITVIIMAANIGYRMKSYGPKSLLNVTPNETLIEYQLNTIQSSFPHADVILVVGFFADRLIKRCPPGIRVVENQLYEETNEVEQIRLALNCTLTDNILVLKDDVIFNNETLCNISKQKSCLIYDSQDRIEHTNIGVTVINGYATTFSYGLSDKWCHIVYLTKKETNILRAICAKRENSKMYLHEALNLMLKRTGHITAIEPSNMDIIKIDTSQHLLQIQDL